VHVTLRQGRGDARRSTVMRRGQPPASRFFRIRPANDSPSRGGDVHPQVACLMAQHINAIGQVFGREKPQSGSKRQAPKARSGNRANRQSRGGVRAAMSVLGSPPAGTRLTVRVTDARGGTGWTWLDSRYCRSR
jgi:hypothetical protein